MRIFDPEGPLMTALSKLSDVVFCNIMFCVCSLPLITIGPALAALYECTMSIVEDMEERSMFKQYWSRFRKHMKQGIVLWLICLGIILILTVYAAAVNSLDGALGRSYKVVLFLLVFLFAAGFQYVFPVQAMMELRVRDVLKTAWLISASALPYTLGMLVIAGAAVYVSVFMGPDTLYKAVFLWAVIGFGLVAYLQSFLLRLAFRRYRRMQGIPDEAELPDPWETENSEDSDHDETV